MKVRFRADNDLDGDIVRGLLRVQPGVEFEAEQLHGLDDEAVLLLAFREDRVLVSHDVSTIPPLYARLRAEQRLPGVILVPQGFPLSQTIERLNMISLLTDAAEWRNRICYLPTLADFVR